MKTNELAHLVGDVFRTEFLTFNSLISIVFNREVSRLLRQSPDPSSHVPHLLWGVVLWCTDWGTGFGCRDGAGED